MQNIFGGRNHFFIPNLISTFEKTYCMAEKVIKVKDNYRTNPESHIPGGSVVETFNDKKSGCLYSENYEGSVYYKSIC
jgi:hypothetical protein